LEKGLSLELFAGAVGMHLAVPPQEGAGKPGALQAFGEKRQ